MGRYHVEHLVKLLSTTRLGSFEFPLERASQTLYVAVLQKSGMNGALLLKNMPCLYKAGVQLLVGQMLIIKEQ